jgi:hypothetical protein
VLEQRLEKPGLKARCVSSVVFEEGLLAFPSTLPSLGRDSDTCVLA